MIISKPYDRERAVTYARTWALTRNPLFVNFTGMGGDCTGFASQCLLAGSCTMDFTPDYGWYYVSGSDRAPAWTSVRYFFDFLTGDEGFSKENGGIGPYAEESDLDTAEEGDFIQLRNAEGVFYHTLVISGFLRDDVLVCAHSDDALDRRLSTYNYASFRVLHVKGVRITIPDDDCWLPLLEGKSIGVTRPDAPSGAPSDAPADELPGEDGMTPAVPAPDGEGTAAG